MSTKYNVEIIGEMRNLVVGLDFVDDLTVAVGHVNGKLVFTQLGMSSIPPQLSIASTTQGMYDSIIYMTHQRLNLNPQQSRQW